MIITTLQSPDVHRAYVVNGPLHSFMQGVDIHLQQIFELMVRPLLPSLGFVSDKAINHALTTNNTNHLKFPLLLSCNIAVTSIGLRVFLSDTIVPDSVKDVSSFENFADQFLIWLLGEQGVKNLFSGKKLTTGAYFDADSAFEWKWGLERRGDKLWSTMLYNSLIVGTSIGLGKAAIRRNNSDARQIFSKTLLKSSVTMGCDTYAKILVYEAVRDHFLKGTDAEALSDYMNVTSNNQVPGKGQGPDELIEEVFFVRTLEM